MRRLVPALALLSLTLLPAAARASSYTDVLHVYQAQGSIPPCRFSSATLAAALRGIDTYGQQYFADFTGAVDTALAQRASGACTPGPKPRVGQSSLRGRTPPLPVSVTSATDASIPAPILVMAGIAVLLGVAVAIGATARAFGWDPPWAARWRHALGEAGYRAGGAFENFTDWWRRGP